MCIDMKRVLLLIGMLVASVIAGKAQDSYKITGNVTGLPDGQLVLAVWDGQKGVVAAKTEITGGKFVFIGSVKEPVWAVIHTPDGQPVASFMLENAEYAVMGKDAVTGGGKAQETWMKFDAINFDLARERQVLEAQYVQAEQKGNKKQMQKIDSAFQAFLVDIQAREVALLKQSTDNHAAAYVVASTMNGLPLARLQERFGLLSSRMQASGFGKAVAERIAKLEQLEIGAIAPDFSLPSSDVGVISLHKTNARLKLVYFWASGDATSRVRNVELLQLHEQYRPKGLDIISVSLDVNKQEWMKAIGEDGMNGWQNGCDLQGISSPAVQSYCVESIPTLFLVDRENCIVGKDLWGINLRKQITKLLKK